MRQRLRDPTPDDQDLGSRLLLAFAFSTVLNGLYLVVLGRHPALLLEGWNEAVGAGPVRASAAFAVLLLVIVPTAIAYLDHQRLRLR